MDDARRVVARAQDFKLRPRTWIELDLARRVSAAKMDSRLRGNDGAIDRSEVSGGTTSNPDLDPGNASPSIKEPSPSEMWEVRHREVPRIGGSLPIRQAWRGSAATAWSMVAAGCPKASLAAWNCDVRHREVPRIGGFIADSGSVDRLCRDRFIVDRGRMPDSTIIRQRQSGRRCRRPLWTRSTDATQCSKACTLALVPDREDHKSGILP
jgi:hypothetical protein